MIHAIGLYELRQICQMVEHMLAPIIKEFPFIIAHNFKSFRLASLMVAVPGHAGGNWSISLHETSK